MPGYIQLILPNKDVLELQTKAQKITGLFYKQKVLTCIDQMVTKDITHGLKSVVKFDCKAK